MQDKAERLKRRNRGNTRGIYREIKRGDITRIGKACKGIKPLTEGDGCRQKRKNGKCTVE